MSSITTIGLDTAKSVFQVHGIDRHGTCQLVHRLKRRQLLSFFAKLDPCTVALEACACAQHWARELVKLGHRALLVPPSFAKLFAQGRRKNDARDAKALALAALSGDLRPVPVKSEAQQADQALVKARGLLVRQHTQTGNALRSHLGEFGFVARTGDKPLEELVAKLESGAMALPQAAIDALAALVRQWRDLALAIAGLTAKLLGQARSNPTVRRLMGVPGVGAIIATVFALKVPDAGRFDCGRNCAAWLGLTPAEHSSGGKRRLRAISKAGDEDLRSLLVLGAAAQLIAAKRFPEKAHPWVKAIIARAPFKVAAVALAARMARILWALLKTGASYRPRNAAPAQAR